jgi:hypothetical protein
MEIGHCAGSETGRTMPIFISYSHQDSDFVDQLALQLVRHRVNVWMDRWELNVGDSLLSKVQEAITGASALLVVLSKASVSSEWVKKEVNAGLFRELDEKKVIVLPVLVEDCQIPVFLRDKLYADFRSDFDAGLEKILESVARISNASTGRIDAPSYETDWALDWGMVEGRAFLRITLIERASEQPLSVLCLAEILADEEATRSYADAVERVGLEEAHRQVTARVVEVVNDPEDLVLMLEDQHERRRGYRVESRAGAYNVQISARRLGLDTGRDLLYRAGQQLRELLQQMSDVMATPGDGTDTTA